MTGPRVPGLAMGVVVMCVCSQVVHVVVIVHQVMVQMVVVHIQTGAEHPGGVHAEANPDRGAVHPNIVRRHRRPAHIVDAGI
ncbi:MAG TPA: hypothetical protein PKD61_20870, partial [Polyangiaceae bacterium]|nr:hypothetical protein [Polyangiaceae bacterium]